MQKGKALTVNLRSAFYIALESLIIFWYHGELIQRIFHSNDCISAIFAVKIEVPSFY